MHPGSQGDGICSELDTPADLADFDPMTTWAWQPFIEIAAIGTSPVAYTIPHEFIIIKHRKNGNFVTIQQLYVLGDNVFIK